MVYISILLLPFTCASGYRTQGLSAQHSSISLSMCIRYCSTVPSKGKRPRVRAEFLMRPPCPRSNLRKNAAEVVQLVGDDLVSRRSWPPRSNDSSSIAGSLFPLTIEHVQLALACAFITLNWKETNFGDTRFVQGWSIWT